MIRKSSSKERVLKGKLDMQGKFALDAPTSIAIVEQNTSL